MVHGMERLQSATRVSHSQTETFYPTSNDHDKFLLQKLFVLTFLGQNMAKSQWLDTLLHLKHTTAVTMDTACTACSGGSACQMVLGMEKLQLAIQGSIIKLSKHLTFI